jgi:hypothetical protein
MIHVGWSVMSAYLMSMKLHEIPIKVGLRGGLQWPLHVFGMVAIRDCADQKRNIIFDRSRDNCQILTQEVCIISYH